MKGGGRGQIDPPTPPGKPTLKKPSLIRVKLLNATLNDVKISNKLNESQ